MPAIPHYCTYKDLTDCLNITIKQCKQASEKSIELCSDKFQLDSKNIEEIRPIIKQVGECSFNQFLLLASITKTEFSTCGPQYIAFNKILLNEIRKEQVESDKRFFEEFNPLHNYNKKEPNK